MLFIIFSKYPSPLKRIVETESHTHCHHAFHYDEVAFATHEPRQQVRATSIENHAACPNTQIPKCQITSAAPGLGKDITDVY